MKSAQKFLAIVLWEALENAPLLIGFLWAVRTQAQSLSTAFIMLVIGTAIGAILIHFTETKKYSNQPTLKETLVNFGVFTLIAIPFVFYCSANGAWWSNSITDIVLGIITGFALSFGESWGWSNKATVKIHSISMSVAFILFLSSIRFTYQLEPLHSILIVGVVLNIFVSGIIVLFDYWPIKESNPLPIN